MPADLSAKDIAFLRNQGRVDRNILCLVDKDGRARLDHLDALLDIAEAHLDEPARLASARAEGVREGWVNGQHRFREEASEVLIEARDRLTSGRTHIIDGRRLGLEQAASMVRLLPAPPCPLALSPPPAEPSALVAPDWPTRCAALEAAGIAARKRVAALKTEVAALREGLQPFADAAGDLHPNHSDTSPIWETPAAMGIDAGDLRRARALLQGQGGADGR